MLLSFHIFSIFGNKILLNMSNRYIFSSTGRRPEELMSWRGFCHPCVRKTFSCLHDKVHSFHPILFKLVHCLYINEDSNPIENGFHQSKKSRIISPWIWENCEIRLVYAIITTSVTFIWMLHSDWIIWSHDRFFIFRWTHFVCKFQHEYSWPTFWS